MPIDEQVDAFRQAFPKSEEDADRLCTKPGYEAPYKGFGMNVWWFLDVCPAGVAWRQQDGSYLIASNTSQSCRTITAFDANGFSAAELEKQVFWYAAELATGPQLKTVSAGVWAARFDNGATINVRSAMRPAAAPERS